ncbi:MAG: trypsin-like peptidase domain-containing protein [Phenylobacterium sp.]|uniref:trypsin-like peptidase domain-containing protein n=2 Tax=Phenylobacterium sp. TaxID=1871053 RepID=UPI002600D335|nr:trypsin-like peptidase domain-containing protein [Phenylobacterium sp.]MCA3711941.1 trypsin-like peptidase domain-containing protein [Phenylobacterium sp.]MCA3728389.1 trypsin-like peptidase domain-containing protein [Phenylobacterium sp.]MCA3751235.1 trypsin-like peptidase domain-containing protein [Phenylobacterium sp.]MCA6230339.1 trypsin-like peptidase domain-containing protein [Phenylobacterium sp.]MCA6240164.1 trypsin-like peptidase domain-containing protein [Phenylobacterium sp.]
MSSTKSRYMIGALAGVLVAGTAMAAAGLNADDRPGAQPAGAASASAAPNFGPPPGAPMSFADIFERVSPAVVSINVTTRVDLSKMPRQIPGLPFEFRPPRQGGDEEGEGEGPRGPRRQSAGSGFFISADGYLVTNTHVIEDAESIKVVLKDETELDATVVGRDEGTDIAVLKVKGSGYTFVNFENSARPRVGDWVLTVGNPYNLGGTATAGIVSAYGRDIGETFVDYIQLDAPINRGNSGGPTFDTYGRVIGVNTAIFSPTGGSVGIGFAVPADVAARVSRQLIANGKVVRGYIGATIQNFDEDMAAAQGMAGQKGAIVAELTPGAPAEKAGLVTGDIVLSVNGVRVRSSSELTRQVAKAAPGDLLRLEIIRGGKPRTVDIRSGVRPPESQLAAGPGGPDGATPGPGRPGPSAGQSLLGMTVAPLDDAGRRRAGLPADARGLIISGVDRSSDAAAKGIQANDVLLRAGDRLLASPADLAAVVDQARRAGRPSVLVAVWRGGRTIFLPVKIAD